MKDNVAYDITNTIRILIPSGMWVTLSFDDLPVDLNLDEPAEAIHRLSQILRCDVSLEQRHQVTARWKE